MCFWHSPIVPVPPPSPAHVCHDHGHEGAHGVRAQQRQHALVQQAAQGGAHAGVAVHHALRQRGQHLGCGGVGAWRCAVGGGVRV